jgi:hypothetical protein
MDAIIIEVPHVKDKSYLKYLKLSIFKLMIELIAKESIGLPNKLL